MTLTLPAAFPKWLVDAVAGYWPECDEDAVRREGDHWKAAGENCRQLGQRHDIASTMEKAALRGYSADTKAARNAQLGNDLRNQAAYCDSMAGQCYQKANDCEFTKLQVIGTGVALLAQLAVDALMSAPGVVKAAEDRAAAEASWSATARRYYGEVKKVGLECATKRKGLPLAKATAIGVALGGGTAAAVNAGAQFYQKEVLHHRDKMDWNMVEDAAIIGGVGGGIGARFASRFAPGINRFLGKVAGNSKSNIVRYGAHVTSGLLIGGVGGLAGAIGGAGAGIVVTGHIPDAKELRTSVIQGFVGGVVGSVTVFARPIPPGMRVNPDRTVPSEAEKTTPPYQKQVWPPEGEKPTPPPEHKPHQPTPAKPDHTPPPETEKTTPPYQKQVWPPEGEKPTPPPEHKPHQPTPAKPDHTPPRHTEKTPPTGGEQVQPPRATDKEATPPPDRQGKGEPTKPQSTDRGPADETPPTDKTPAEPQQPYGGKGEPWPDELVWPLGESDEEAAPRPEHTPDNDPSEPANPRRDLDESDRHLAPSRPGEGTRPLDRTPIDGEIAEPHRRLSPYPSDQQVWPKLATDKPATAQEHPKPEADKFAAQEEQAKPPATNEPDPSTGKTPGEQQRLRTEEETPPRAIESVGPVNPPSHIFPTERQRLQLNTIIDTVKYRAVSGKFPSELDLPAVNAILNEPLHFETHGYDDNGVYPDGPGGRIVRNIDTTLRTLEQHKSTPEFFKGKPLLAFVENDKMMIQGKPHGMVVYNFPVRLNDAVGREVSRLTISSLLPSADMKSLRDLVVSDPRTLDLYLQRIWGDSPYLARRMQQSPLILFENTPATPNASDILLEAGAASQHGGRLTQGQRDLFKAMFTIRNGEGVLNTIEIPTE
ncbi:WXG100-like domain-containing protein [Nocardia anaemiae]|uniref:WXG100-like domain-containing protein n=1 Tax=Nocardia anaemiae TaxID=263910 RepID=UPI0007A54C87|nr:hypothetical protein [Nocardia anaemiae]